MDEMKYRADYQCHDKYSLFFLHGRYVIFKGIDPFAKSSLNKIHVWDATTGLDKFILQDHSNEVTCIEVSHSNQFAFTGSQDSTVIMWKIQTGKVHHKFTGHDSGVCRIWIRPDDHYMVCLTFYNMIHVWDIKQCKKVFVYNTNTAGDVTCAVLTPQNILLFGTSCGELHLKLWSPDSGDVSDLGSLLEQSSGVTNVALSDDGTLLASAYDDPYVIVWHLKTMEPLYQIEKVIKTFKLKVFYKLFESPFHISKLIHRKQNTM